jgi:hypothetical protein
MSAPATNVARVHRGLATLDASDDADAAWLAECLRLWLAGAPFDEAVGLAGGWRGHLRRREQEAALGRLLGALGPFPSGRAAGDALKALLSRKSTAAAGHRLRPVAATTF